MRKLAIGSGAFFFAVLLADTCLPALPMFPVGLLLSLSLVFLALNRRRWILPAAIAVFSFLAGLFYFGVYSELTAVPAHRLDGTESKGNAVVLSCPVNGDGYAKAEVCLRTGEGVRIRTILYDRSGALENAVPGDVLEGTFRLKAADIRYGEVYNSNKARGVFLTANNEKELTLSGERRISLSILAARWNGLIVERIGEIFPEDTAAFFKALMLGEKTEFYRDDAMYLAMSRAGLMHMVAVSGMHIAFFAGMLRHLLGNTRRSAILTLILTWCFVLICGASPSAVRAAIMLSLLLFAPIVGRENDPPTSLLFALLVILLTNPFAVGSVSLQLSFSAMAGIMLFSDPIRNRIRQLLPERCPRRLNNYLSSCAANSLSVLVFTLPLTALHFGYIPILSPLANVFALWAVPICFGGGSVCCLLSCVWLPLGKALAWGVSWFGRWVLFTAKTVSAPGFSCLYLNLDGNVVWLVMTYLLLIAALFSRRRFLFRWGIPIILSAAGLFALMLGTKLYYEHAGAFFTAVDVGQGQSLVAFTGDDTVVVDCGNINSVSDAGDLTGSYLRSRGRDQIDLLVLTHLHSDHADGVTRLLEYMPVDTILIGPDMDDPHDLLPQITSAAEKHGTRILFLEEDSTLQVGTLRVEAFQPGSSGDVNERCLSVLVSYGDYDMLVTGDMNMSAERELMRNHPLRDCELLIVGHHGSKYSCSPELLRSIGANEAIISCGYNTYGHPTEETLERLAECGYTVFRTDRDGTIEKKIA